MSGGKLHATGRADAPRYPVTISLVVKSPKQSSMTAINRRRAASGERWQPRFFDRGGEPAAGGRGASGNIL